AAGADAGVLAGAQRRGAVADAARATRLARVAAHLAGAATASGARRGAGVARAAGLAGAAARGAHRAARAHGHGSIACGAAAAGLDGITAAAREVAGRRGEIVAATIDGGAQVGAASGGGSVLRARRSEE